MCHEVRPIREFYTFKKGVRTKGGGTVRQRHKECRKCRKTLYDRKWRLTHRRWFKRYHREYWKNRHKKNPNRLENK